MGIICGFIFNNHQKLKLVLILFLKNFLNKIDKSYPMLALSDCIFDLDYYFEIIEPKVSKLEID